MISNKNILIVLFVICIILITMNAGINGCKESIDTMKIQQFENEIKQIEELYKKMNETGDINNIQKIQELLTKINILQNNADTFLDSLKEELEGLIGIENKVKSGVQSMKHKINILN